MKRAIVSVIRWFWIGCSTSSIIYISRIPVRIFKSDVLARKILSRIFVSRTVREEPLFRSECSSRLAVRQLRLPFLDHAVDPTETHNLERTKLETERKGERERERELVIGRTFALHVFYAAGYHGGLASILARNVECGGR